MIKRIKFILKLIWVVKTKRFLFCKNKNGSKRDLRVKPFMMNESGQAMVHKNISNGLVILGAKCKSCGLGFK